MAPRAFSMIFLYTGESSAISSFGWPDLAAEDFSPSAPTTASRLSEHVGNATAAPRFKVISLAILGRLLGPSRDGRLVPGNAYTGNPWSTPPSSAIINGYNKLAGLGVGAWQRETLIQ